MLGRVGKGYGSGASYCATLLSAGVVVVSPLVVVWWWWCGGGVFWSQLLCASVPLQCQLGLGGVLVKKVQHFDIRLSDDLPRRHCSRLCGLHKVLIGVLYNITKVSRRFFPEPEIGLSGCISAGIVSKSAIRPTSVGR